MRVCLASLPGDVRPQTSLLPWRFIVLYDVLSDGETAGMIGCVFHKAPVLCKHTPTHTCSQSWGLHVPAPAGWAFAGHAAARPSAPCNHQGCVPNAAPGNAPPPPWACAGLAFVRAVRTGSRGGKPRSRLAPAGFMLLTRWLALCRYSFSADGVAWMPGQQVQVASNATWFKVARAASSPEAPHAGAINVLGTRRVCVCMCVSR
jgi:hypothetical protein